MFTARTGVNTFIQIILSFYGNADNVSSMNASVYLFHVADQLTQVVCFI